MAKRGRRANNTILVRNRQPRHAVNLRLLRKIARSLLLELRHRESFDLGVYLVGAAEMARLNETFLRHRGSTDVLAFDYAGGPTHAGVLSGEVFVCVDEARRQARRFRTSWQSELVRYMTHGILHLCGYDDRRTISRRKMKREENRLVKELAKQFRFSSLGRADSRTGVRIIPQSGDGPSPPLVLRVLELAPKQSRRG